MFEAFSVGVRLSLVNQVTAGLMGISSAFARVHGDARQLQGQLDRIKLTLAGGAALAGTGFFGLAMIGKTIEPAREYAHQLALMNTAGMRQVDIVKSINAAWALNKTVPTSTATQNLEAIRELRTVLGDTQEAINFLPQAQKMAYILQNVRGSTDSKGEVQAAGRALDRRNATASPQEAAVQTDLMLKAIVASGGVLSAKDFAQTFMYGRSATQGWSNEFAYKILPSLMQEFKSGNGSGAGGGPGNPLMSAYNAVVNGVIPQKALPVWMELDLLNRNKVVWTKSGEAKGLLPGGIKNYEKFISNPYAWALEDMVPAMERAKYTEAQKRQAIGYLFPNRTAAAVISTMVFQSRAIERDRKMFDIAQGMGAYETLMKNDPMAAQAALTAQWKNLLTVIGFEILPVVVSGTLKLIDGLRDLAAWMREHPKTTKALVLGFAALSAAMAFSGTVLLLSGSFRAMNLAIGLLTGARGAAVAGAQISGLAGSVSTMTPVVSALATAAAAAALPIALIAGGLAVIGGIAWHQNRLDKAWNKGADPKSMTDHEIDLALTKPRNARMASAIDARKEELRAEQKRRGITGSPVVPRGNVRIGGNGDGNVYLDGKKVGRFTTGWTARSMGGANQGSARRDPSAALPSTGAGVSR
jgi:hypothetical protein